jgi:cobalt/nickel transport system permease protein
MIVAHVRGHRVMAEGLDEHAKSSWLSGLDARAKLIGILAFVVATSLLTETRLVLASLAFSVAFAALSRVPPRHLARAYLSALPFILIASVSVFLFAGYDRGLDMWARTSSCVLALLVLASGTETFELFAGLRRLRMPAIITTLLMLTYKYILMMSEELSRMTVARKARGFAGGRSLLDSRGIKVISYTAGMVFVRSAERADRAFDALTARGFDKEMRGWRRSKIAAPELSFVAWFVTVSAILMLLQLGVSP